MPEGTLTWAKPDYIYAKTVFSRCEAWERLLKLHPGPPQSHWRKSHSATHWGWYAVEWCDHKDCIVCANLKPPEAEAEPEYDCPFCQGGAELNDGTRDHCDECSNTGKVGYNPYDDEDS
jgi:hypothetical protein